jgi:hypothetical protein
MTADRLRRRLRLLPGRSLRLLRAHYFSFVSAAVIGGIFVFAMTSSSFGGSEGTASPRATTVSQSTFRPSFRTRPASVVYYIVASTEQRDAILNAAQSDQIYRAATAARTGPDEIDFFISNNAEQDVIVAGLVANALDIARQNGIGLRIIDARH